MELAKVYDAEIKVVHIITEDEYHGQTQMECLKEILVGKVDHGKMEFKLFFSAGIFELLRIYPGDVNSNMDAMLVRGGKGNFKEWIQCDLVQKMESYGKLPLLSFRKCNHQLFYCSVVL